MAEKDPRELTLSELHDNLGKLSALLAMAYGEGGAQLRRMDDTLQDNYMWTCAELSSRCERIAQALVESA